MLLTVIILYRYPLKTRHHKFSEKSKHFSYSNYFTYLVYQHQGCDQRGPDNQGSTVYTNFVVTFFHGDKQLKFPSPDPLSNFHKRDWPARLIIGLILLLILDHSTNHTVQSQEKRSTIIVKITDNQKSCMSSYTCAHH